jgi:hypothetical protein
MQCLYGDSGIRQKDNGTGKTASSHIIEKCPVEKKYYKLPNENGEMK